MARGRGGDPWHRYPPSVPLPVEGGLSTSKQRGAIASTWWSQRFVAVLESFGLGTRMQRGRRYARTGQVVSLEVRSALLAAQVQGSRPTPYRVTITLAEPSEDQWRKIDDAMTAKVGFVAHLLSGELPAELEEVFKVAGVELFPGSWSKLRAACSCPDRENPCKHIAAVLYVFADHLDTDPWLALAWRGRTRERVLERFHTTAGPPLRVAPWWPFGAGPLPMFDNGRLGESDGASTMLPPGEPAGVLDTLAPVEIEIAGVGLVDLVRPAYDAACAPLDS